VEIVAVTEVVMMELREREPALAMPDTPVPIVLPTTTTAMESRIQRTTVQTSAMRLKRILTGILRAMLATATMTMTWWQILTIVPRSTTLLGETKRIWMQIATE
jgi:hypothetical protein